MTNEQSLDPRLLEILVCPLCHGKLFYCKESENLPESDHVHLDCNHCGKGYPIRNGIPVMLVEEAILLKSIK